MPSSEVFHKWKTGKLHSGSKTGPPVKSHAQAVAIFMSEKRKEGQHGGKYPHKAVGGGLGGTPPGGPLADNERWQGFESRFPKDAPPSDWFMNPGVIGNRGMTGLGQPPQWMPGGVGLPAVPPQGSPMAAFQHLQQQGAARLGQMDWQHMGQMPPQGLGQQFPGKFGLNPIQPGMRADGGVAAPLSPEEANAQHWTPQDPNNLTDADKTILLSPSYNPAAWTPSIQDRINSANSPLGPLRAGGGGVDDDGPPSGDVPLPISRSPVLQMDPMAAGMLQRGAAPTQEVIPPSSPNVAAAIKRASAWMQERAQRDPQPVLQRNIQMMLRGGPMAEAIAKHTLSTFQPHPSEALPAPPPLTIEGEQRGGRIGLGYQFGGSPTSMGLTPGWIERQEARNISHTGPIISAVGGRTDNHPISVPSGSYVMPADSVSHLGQGNTLNGMQILTRMFGAPMKTPHGPGPPRMHAPRLMGMSSSGGSRGDAHLGRPVDIAAAGGEFVIHPHAVMKVGGGNLDDGHRILDRWVLNLRKKHIKTLNNLPPPAKS